MKSILHIIFIFFLFSLRLFSQNDSIKKIKFSGFQLELNGIGIFNTVSIPLSKFVSINPTDSLVTKDFSSYSNGFGGGYQSSFNGTFVGRLFFSLPKKYKLGIDIYAGFIFYNSSLGYAGYFKTTVDTTNFFIGTYTNTSQGYYQIKKTNYGYSFDLSATFIQIPLGINFNTNKQKRLWFNFGLEFAPGFTFNHKYKSSLFKNSDEYLSDPNNPSGGYQNYISRFSGGLEYSTTKKLNGIGFVGQLTVPLSMQIRFSNRIKFLKHLNLVSTIAPGMYLTANKYSGTKTNFTTNLVLGLRYNLF